MCMGVRRRGEGEEEEQRREGERERSVGFLFRNSFPKNGWII